VATRIVMAFQYNSQDSYESNFQRWYKAHKLEYECYDYPHLEEPEARAKFDSHFSGKKIKIKRIKKW